MPTPDDIRRRLAAVEGIDWTKVKRGHDEEYYSDWLYVGPVMMLTTFSPGPEDLADVAKVEAVAEFLQHAASDIRRLLDERGQP
jgi:hypothetical protein